jgi:Lrp/AsnC family transcriptional regulator, regulator for asnA, asnC and gidA
VTTSPEHLLDELDRAIFAALQRDGRRSFRSIGVELGVAEETIRFRVKRMLREELVQITAFIHPQFLGGILATLLIKSSLPARKGVVAQLKSLPAVMYVSVCSGRYDIDLQVVVTGLDELNQLMNEELAKIDGILEVEPLIELEVVKTHYEFSRLGLLQGHDRG